MIMAADKISKEHSIAASKKIKEIRAQLTNDNWNEICAKYSEHTKTKDKGGELGIIKIGGSLGSPEFEEVAFALKNPGDISKPVKTAYGWHIIKFNSEVIIPPFKNQEKELINKVSKNGAIVEMGKIQFAEKIKTEYGFKETLSSIEKSKSIIDSSYLTRNWKYNKNDVNLSIALFKLGSKEYFVKDFFQYLENHRSWYVKKSVETVFSKDYENYKIKMVFAFEEANLPQKHPAYRHLVQEYRDGILLFDLMNKTIWKKSSSDTTALKNYYNMNKKSYQWNERATATIYHLYDTTKYTQLITQLNNGDSPTEKDFNGNSSLTLKIENKTIEKGSKNEDFKNLKWKKGIQETSKQDYKIIIVIEELIPSSDKEFKECKGQVISDYQEVMTNDWIKELKKKHNYTLHEDVLKSLAKN
jgi:peptidyl-prolyl cis-trans isomerase SurA